jgi:hypothetical protein
LQLPLLSLSLLLLLMMVAPIVLQFHPQHTPIDLCNTAFITFNIFNTVDIQNCIIIIVSRSALYPFTFPLLQHKGGISA